MPVKVYDSNPNFKESKNNEKKQFKKLKREYKADLSKSKRAKYCSASLSAHRVFKDLKNCASKQISSVRNSFENLISQKLRLRSPKEGHCKSIYDSGCVYYKGFENEPRSPIKMYSPFGIVSPSPNHNENKKVFSRRRNIKSSKSLHEQLLLSSPTGKIKEDVRIITNSLNELSLLSADIQCRYCVKTSSSNFSITTQ